jgi:hypothetical protein
MEHCTGPNLFVFTPILYTQKVQRYAAQRGTTHIRVFLGEFATIFENIVGHESGSYIWLFDGKNQRAKISWHCLFKCFNKGFLLSFHSSADCALCAAAAAVFLLPAKYQFDNFPFLQRRLRQSHTTVCDLLKCFHRVLFWPSFRSSAEYAAAVRLFPAKYQLVNFSFLQRQLCQSYKWYSCWNAIPTSRL